MLKVALTWSMRSRDDGCACDGKEHLETDIKVLGNHKDITGGQETLVREEEGGRTARVENRKFPGW